MQLDAIARRVVRKYAQEKLEEIKEALMMVQSEENTAILRGKCMELTELIEAVEDPPAPLQ